MLLRTVLKRNTVSSIFSICVLVYRLLRIPTMVLVMCFVGHQGESDSESSETSDSIGASSVSGCLEGVAVPRQMVVPLILATMAEVAQYGVASSLGEIGAQMTDPDSCTGAAGKEVYRWLSGKTTQSFPFQVRLLQIYSTSSKMYPHDFTCIYRSCSCYQVFGSSWAIKCDVSTWFYMYLLSSLWKLLGNKMWCVTFVFVKPGQQSAVVRSTELMSVIQLLLEAIL